MAWCILGLPRFVMVMLFLLGIKSFHFIWLYIVIYYGSYHKWV